MKKIMLPALIAPLLLAGCGSSTPTKSSDLNDMQTQNAGNIGKLGGGDGLVLGVGGKNGKTAATQDGAVLGVNAYLWRATLDVLSFMPLASADPFGGVIITDWYQPPQARGERFKATAYILGRQLRADGVRVSLFRQTAEGGHWLNATISPSTTGEIEDKILARARELREQAAAQN